MYDPFMTLIHRFLVLFVDFQVKEYVCTRIGLKRVCLLIDTKWGMKQRDHELVDLMERQLFISGVDRKISPNYWIVQLGIRQSTDSVPYFFPLSFLVVAVDLIRTWFILSYSSFFFPKSFPGLLL